MLKKDAFKWDSRAEAAFDELKHAMTDAPILSLLDFSKTFIVECDASGIGIGAVLIQENRPIVFLVML